MIAASGEIGVEVMDLCQCKLVSRRMSNELKTSVIVRIFKEKSDVMNYGSYRKEKLLEHAMKIVERVPERQIKTLISWNKMQFRFMPGKEIVDAISIVRRMQEEYQKKDKKLYICSVDTEKTSN